MVFNSGHFQSNTFELVHAKLKFSMELDIRLQVNGNILMQ